VTWTFSELTTLASSGMAEETVRGANADTGRLRALASLTGRAIDWELTCTIT